MARYVYRFDEEVPHDDLAALKALLGGKGAGLNQMTRLGFPVPPGFTLTTEVSRHFGSADAELPKEIRDAVEDALGHIEKDLGRKLGDPERPLLLSVRSGARVSMPGMMDTILNLGLNDETAAGLAEASGDRRFAFDAYRRLIIGKAA